MAIAVIASSFTVVYLNLQLAVLRTSSPPEIQVYFSPRGGCTEAVIAELAKAKQSVYVFAYSFTSEPIANALIAADKRGVETWAIIDRSQRAERSSVDEIHEGGVVTKIDAKHAIFHDKVMVIDEKVVVTGSFNFTKAAEERNAENLLIIHDAILAKRYIKNWMEHAEHSGEVRTQ